RISAEYRRIPRTRAFAQVLRRKMSPGNCPGLIECLHDITCRCSSPNLIDRCRKVTILCVLRSKEFHLSDPRDIASRAYDLRRGILSATTSLRTDILCEKEKYGCH